MRKLFNNMKKVKFALLGVLGIFLLKGAYAQQIPQYTQYMFNNFISNPAVAGTNNFYQIQLNNRYQWVGINDAPQTVSTSVFGPHSKKDMGFGASIYMDITGPTSKLGLMGSYAYNMQINRNMRISGGISFGLMQYKVDGSKLTLGENLDSSLPIDPAILGSTKSVFTPDASIGFYLYASDFFAGLSAHQLFGQRLKLYPDPIGINKLKQHILASGGYIWNLNRYYRIEPAILIKYMFNSPLQVELNGKVTYRKQMWGGLSYRYNDGMAILIGYNYKNRYLFGLSYDYSFTSLGHYQVGTYEIMIGYMFDKIK